jgi:hypothetical protein
MVESEVERGAGVDPPSYSFDVTIDETPRASGRSLEEHVLQVVSEAELGGRLVAAAGPHPQLDRDDLTRRVLLNEDADAVVEDVTAGRLQT